MSCDNRPLLRLGHSPDPDDAFMWWPLVEHDGRPARIDTGRFRYESVMDDIESLNQRSMSSELEITAQTDRDEIMGVRHRELPLEGVQFHPESVLTPDGDDLMANFMRMTTI